MSISSRRRLGSLVEKRAGRWCLVAVSLAASALPPVAAQASQVSQGSAFRVGNEERVATQQASGRKKGTYNGPGRRIGGAGSTKRTHATDDNCHASADKQSSFLRVFANDAIKWQSTIEWSTVHGNAQLIDFEDDSGFSYEPNPDYSEDQIFYRIVSPDDPPEHSEATVNISLRMGPEECGN
jgi:hypothetical protein